MTNRRAMAFIAGVGMAVVLLLWALSLRGGNRPVVAVRGTSDPPVVEVGQSKPISPDLLQTSRGPIDIGAGAAGGSSIFVSALKAMDPQREPIHCELPTWLNPAGLRPVGPQLSRARDVDFIWVDDVTFRAGVRETSGSMLLRTRAGTAARISWSDGACKLTPPEFALIRGVVTSADGSPAVGALVRGCEPGDLAVVDEEGQYEVKVVRGSACQPMAVIETDDAFGKQPGRRVRANSDVVSLDLSAPTQDQLWGLDVQRGLAQSFAHMSQSHLEEIPAISRPTGSSSAEQALIDLWVEETMTIRARAADQAEELLADPTPEKLREAFLFDLDAG
jgi:hypothetical protein